MGERDGGRVREGGREIKGRRGCKEPKCEKDESRGEAMNE